MNILHLSDTTLSGAIIRIVDLTNKYTSHQARHIVWQRQIRYRVFKTDLVGEEMRRAELMAMLEWPDVIHYHNRWRRQEIFQVLGIKPPNKPSVIQIHSPRMSEDFSDEVASKIPLAIVGQYHPRQWEKELSYIVPNVVDIHDPIYLRADRPVASIPIVSYAPSNWNCRGWDSKGYEHVVPVLKRMAFDRLIHYKPVIAKPHAEAMAKKREADIGIDEIVTGSYHLSALEYMAMGVPCYTAVDALTEKVVKDMTGCETFPWLLSKPGTFRYDLSQLIRSKGWQQAGKDSRAWMEKYWAPEPLTKKYIEMYESL